MEGERGPGRRAMFRLARTTIKAGRVKEKTLKRRNHNATGGGKSHR